MQFTVVYVFSWYIFLESSLWTIITTQPFGLVWQRNFIELLSVTELYATIAIINEQLYIKVIFNFENSVFIIYLHKCPTSILAVFTSYIFVCYIMLQFVLLYIFLLS